MHTTTPWWEGGLVGFDLETTGPDPETARIVTANLTYHHPGRPEPRVRDWLVNPGIDIPEAATAVHGITTDHARTHGQPPADAIAGIIDLLNVSKYLPLVGFNLVYDLTVMDREARRHGLDVFVPQVVIDGFVLDKQLNPYRRGSRKLTTVCDLYAVDLANAHSADADALASVLLARKMGQTGNLPADPAELHNLQITWRAAQQASFEEYLARKGTPETLPRQWPVIPLPQTVAA